MRQYPNHEKAGWVAHECVGAQIHGGRPGAARALIEARAETVGWDFGLRHDLGAVLLAEGRFADALALYEDLASWDGLAEPELAEANFYAAWSVMKGGSLKEAIRRFDELAERWAEYPDLEIRSLVDGARYHREQAERWLEER